MNIKKYLHRNWTFWIASFLIVTGIALTFVAWGGLCSVECAETHNFRFFGLHFEPIGLVFFLTLGVLLYFSGKLPILSFVMGLMIAGALGAEAVFVGIQKYVIGQWCPVCLSIAATVAALALVLIIDYLKGVFNPTQNHKRGSIMIPITKAISSISVFAIGLTLALAGVAKPEASFAEGVDNQDPSFGNKDSQVEVYVITDWFCPACRKLEPTLDKLYPKIMKEANLIFVDRVIHPETMNYIPYNLSFMVKEKDKYFEIRKALHKLSLNNKTPTPDQIQDAVKGLGVTYQQLNFSDLQSGVKFFEGIAKTFKVNSTPTVVVANRKKLNAKKFVGEEITETHILQAIDEVNR